MSGVRQLKDASFSYSSLSGWEEAGALGGFLGLSRAVWRTRAYGDFWSHVLVAEGAVDTAAEPEVSLWDVAAIQVIVDEAGGRFTDLSGAVQAGWRQRGVHQRASARRGSATAGRGKLMLASQVHKEVPALP